MSWGVQSGKNCEWAERATADVFSARPRYAPLSAFSHYRPCSSSSACLTLGTAFASSIARLAQKPVLIAVDDSKVFPIS